MNGRIHKGQGFIHILQVFKDFLVPITLAPFSTMKISLEHQNYSIFVLALKYLVNGIYGLFFYAGTNQKRISIGSRAYTKRFYEPTPKMLAFCCAKQLLL